MATILDHLLGVGLSEPRARDHLRGGYVRVGGDIVTDPGVVVPDGARVVLQPSRITEET